MLSRKQEIKQGHLNAGGLDDITNAGVKRNIIGKTIEKIRRWSSAHLKYKLLYNNPKTLILLLTVRSWM
jgi:hypothetical protein